MAAAWAAAFLAAAAISLLGTPLLRRMALSIGFLDQPDARKSHHSPVPYLGGVAIGLGALAGMVFGTGVVPEIAVVCVGALVLGVMGLLDDRRTLAPRLRLGTQTAAAVAAVAVGARIHATDIAAFDIALTVLWIVGITNAFNLLDNMDGLAGGIATMASAAVFALAALGGQMIVGGLAAALVGACVGFLAYNVRPAAIYMGDAGSLFLGYLLAIATLELDPALRPPASFLVPLILLSLAVLDTSTVTFARLRRGRRVSQGGRDHLSHRLVARGLSPGTAVALLVAVQALLGITAVAAGRGWLPLTTAVLVTTGLLALVASMAWRAPVYSDEIVGLPRKIVFVAIAGVAVVVAAAAPAALALISARSTLSTAAAAAERGLSAGRRGNQELAATQLGLASAAFARADATLAGPLTSAGLAVPVLSSNLRAARTVSSVGGELAVTAREVVAAADAGRLTIKGGRVPIDQIRLVQPDLARGAQDLERADRRLEATSRRFLVPPLREAVDELGKRVEKASGETARAAEAASFVPAMLGGDGTRRYFLAVQNNAELRATGGFIGNFGEIVAENGALTFARFGRINELNLAGGQKTLDADVDFQRLYGGGFDVARTWQNVNLSPDLPTVAKVIADLYPKSGGQPIDGVITVDPFGLAAILQLTGPVRVSGWPEPITAKNVAEVTMQDAYDRFERDVRADFLGDAANTIWQTFLTKDLPPPARVGRVLADAARAKHLQFHSLEEDEGAFLRKARVNGALAEPPADALLVVSQNAAGNKADYYLHRNVSMDIDLAPVRLPLGSDDRGMPTAAGISTDLTVGFRNETPTSGHARIAIGPYDRNYVAGENRSYVSLYSPLDFSSAKLGSEPIGLASATEAGHRVYSTYLSMSPGATSKLSMSLNGLVPLRDRGWYSLDLVRQPTVHPDEMTVRVRVPAGWRIAQTEGMTRTSARTAQFSGPLLRDTRLRIQVLPQRSPTLQDEG